MVNHSKPAIKKQPKTRDAMAKIPWAQRKEWAVNSPLSTRAAAERYIINQKTIMRWRGCRTRNVAPPKARGAAPKLSAEQEEEVVDWIMFRQRRKMTPCSEDILQHVSKTYKENR
eukprot:TRINITY_DN62140_c0_g1_i1.p3 TRINITY_DN62140_c0_g1~~TRINITY_DN62140_c0_g1_i1.p3  ORF type:complete len:134 (-),score=16.56 TRINITY_DN62140_c0_g1_i1:797-1141(-)